MRFVIANDFTLPTLANSLDDLSFFRRPFIHYFDMTSNDSATSSSAKLQKPSYWRSLSEFRGSEDFSQFLDREFPVAASEFPEGVSRRRWMQLMGASLAVAGVSGCRYPVETIEPFVIRPEGRIPGESYTRATNFELANRVYNLLISCVDGRPLKIEPNTDHPSGLGTDVYAQASILGLYDPDRSRGDGSVLLKKGETRRLPADWPEFDDYALARIDESLRSGQGRDFAVLMPPTTSLSLVRMLSALKKRLPSATFCRYDGVTGETMRAATTQVFGKPARQSLSLDQADVIVAIQADILGNDRGMLANAASFAKRRDPLDDQMNFVEGKMNRLYVVEGGYTSTGAAADSRLALRPGQMPAFLAELARRVAELSGGVEHDHSDESEAFNELAPGQRLERFLDVLAHDIVEAGEKAVIVVGEHLGADAVAAGIRMNQQLGSLGKAQTFAALDDGEIGETVSLPVLTEKLRGGEFKTLLILGNNPVFTAPGDIDFTAALANVDQSIYIGEYDDETGSLCSWSLAQSHPLESWGDCVNDDGYYGVCQPQILPLLGGRSPIEILATMLGEQETEGSAIVRRTADSVAGSSLSERQWRQLLHDGFSSELIVDRGELSVSGDAKVLSTEGPKATTEIDTDDFEVIFLPADGIYDGRFANNGWLQEMPQSLTKLTWDNAAVMSPSTAAALKIRHGNFVNLTVGQNRKLGLPVYEIPGCAPGVVTATIGYGRRRAGMVGGNEDEGVEIIGIDVSPIRVDESMQIAYGVKARPNYGEYELATTQDHWAIDERGREEAESRSFSLIREGTTQLLEQTPHFAEAKGPHVPQVGAHGSLWKEPMQVIKAENKEQGNNIPQWGMAIDLSKCIGCNACVIACQSENNVPIVGREQVLNSREMHWLRVDRYFQGDEENADIVQQPVACMHCETAPCEQVCPVAATVHTEEGINAMAYNRCIGTRYCANNCPFKVRRFNYFNYNQEIGVGYGLDAYPGTIETANRKLQALVMNPEVTVRGRGVMEKCTYCIQRVETAKITARKEGGRPIRDGDVVTACQSACPTRAINFGSIVDENAIVYQMRNNDPRSYGMLSQLNLKPRTEYLARIRNPHIRLMTTHQRADLVRFKDYVHGHGGHGDHGDHGDAGGHGDHGDAGPDHAAETHAIETHAQEEVHVSDE